MNIKEHILFWTYLIKHIRPKYMNCSHEWAVTDSQGYSMECVNCGTDWSLFNTWGEKFNNLGGYFNLTERLVGFLYYKYIAKESQMTWNRLEIF